ncbi:MAG: CsgG/HfaB family protein [Aureispira sp.]
MKKIILALLIGLPCISFAQQQTVGVFPFSYSQGQADAGDASTATEIVTDALVSTGQFNILDRASFATIATEKELQKTEDFIDGEVIEQGKSLGAQYIISGKVMSATCGVTQLYGGIQTSTCKTVISIKLIDVSTSSIKAAQTFNTKGSASRASAALSKTFEKLKPEVQKFVVNNFMSSIPVVELAKSKKDEATEIVIAAGSSILSKKEKLDVVIDTEVEVGGKIMKRQKVIGSVIVSKIEDKNFSVCTVKKGGEVIKAKLDANIKIGVRKPSDD